MFSTEAQNDVAVTVFLLVALAVFLARCALGFRGGWFKGRLVCKSALRRIAAKTAGVQIQEGKRDLYARWPLNFGQPDAPRGWLTLKYGRVDAGEWGLQLLIEGDDFDHKAPQHLHSWVWKAAPFPTRLPDNVWQVKDMRGMVDEVSGIINLLLRPEAQQACGSPRALWEDARNNYYNKILPRRQ